MNAELVQRERRAPRVVADRAHRHFEPGVRVAVCMQQHTGDLVVAIRNRVGFDDDRVAEHALHREPAAVERGPHVLDHDAATAVGGQRHARTSLTLRSNAMPSGGSVSDSVW